MASKVVRHFRLQLIFYVLLLVLNAICVGWNAWSTAALFTEGLQYLAALSAVGSLASIVGVRFSWTAIRLTLQTWALQRLTQDVIARAERIQKPPGGPTVS